VVKKLFLWSNSPKFWVAPCIPVKGSVHNEVLMIQKVPKWPNLLCYFIICVKGMSKMTKCVRISRCWLDMESEISCMKYDF
jgi:hypothetical protein